MAEQNDTRVMKAWKDSIQGGLLMALAPCGRIKYGPSMSLERAADPPAKALRRHQREQ
jgi:hypothetical protein